MLLEYRNFDQFVSVIKSSLHNKSDLKCRYYTLNDYIVKINHKNCISSERVSWIVLSFSLIYNVLPLIYYRTVDLILIYGFGMCIYFQNCM